MPGDCIRAWGWGRDSGKGLRGQPGLREPFGAFCAHKVLLVVLGISLISGSLTAISRVPGPVVEREDLWQGESGAAGLIFLR